MLLSSRGKRASGLVRRVSGTLLGERWSRQFRAQSDREDGTHEYLVD